MSGCMRMCDSSHTHSVNGEHGFDSTFNKNKQTLQLYKNNITYMTITEIDEQYHGT